LTSGRFIEKRRGDETNVMSYAAMSTALADVYNEILSFKPMKRMFD